MKVKMYVNWNEREILKEEEFKERVKDYAEENAEDTYERNARLYDFLTDRKSLDMIDVYNLTAEQKGELEKEFEKYLLEDAEELLMDDYDEVILEV